MAATDQQDRLVLGLERQRRGFGEIVQQSDAADRRRRQDAAAQFFSRKSGLVVERDIAGHHREVERAAGFRDALQAADELAHDFRPLRIAEIEIVGDGERPPADRGDIAPGLRHRRHAALIGIGLAITRGDVDRQRQSLRPVLHPHHCRIAARTLQGIAENDVIVLLPNPAFRAKLGRRDQLFQRG